jgi:hypothetical protein
MSWLKHLFTRRRRYDELSETIREHLDEKIADLTDRGMTREEAERTARREFAATGAASNSCGGWWCVCVQNRRKLFCGFMSSSVSRRKLTRLLLAR